MARIKVVTILGTRPEIIRLSETMRLLDQVSDHVMIHTGQNYDFELNEVFFRDLGLRRPDHVLSVKADTVGQQIANILSATDVVLRQVGPDAVLILGDTNSALACIVAKRLRIPTFHMEAGNRCFDERVPEEVNRRIVDHTADVNLPYTQNARLNLVREGLPADRIIVTGSPMAEILAKHKASIAASPIMQTLGLTPGSYVLATLHREENVDDPVRLADAVTALEAVAREYARPVLVSTHPRTRKRLDDLHHAVSADVRFVRPFGFFDFVRLQQDSFCTLSDSGTIHEDAAILGFPAVVLRDVTERPEAIEWGNVVVAGVRPAEVVAAVALARHQHERGLAFDPPLDYRVTNVSAKVARIVVGQARILRRRIWG